MNARAVEVALLSYLGRLEGLENWSLSDGAGPFELSRERASSLALGRESESKRNPKDLPTAEQVLFAALRMFHNQAAIARMTESLGVSAVDAESALAKLPKAAIGIAAEKRMARFVQVANRIHFP
jgi:hypothetical protein